MGAGSYTASYSSTTRCGNVLVHALRLLGAGAAGVCTAPRDVCRPRTGASGGAISTTLQAGQNFGRVGLIGRLGRGRLLVSS